MQRLREFLHRAVPDTPRARRYQGLLDEIAEGEMGRYRSPGLLAHVVAWCWRCPLSRFHRNADLLAIAINRFREYMAAEKGDGIWHFGDPASKPGFEQGWYAWEPAAAFVLLHDQLDPGYRKECLDKFRRCAERFSREMDYQPFSNQAAAKAGAMGIYALLLEEPRYFEIARRVWDEGWWMIDENDQIIEQGGPSAHYQYLTVHFLHLYWTLTGEHRLDPKFRRAMEWWRHSHTESMYPLQGMSTRYNYERICHVATWCIPVLEHFAPEQPMFQRLADKILAAVEQHHGREAIRDPNLILALLEHRGEFEPSPADVERWEAPFDRMYRSPNRVPVCQYILVKRRYQTAVTFQGYPEMKGLQTWAWGDEPPILQATHEVHSATRGWGFDTALSNVSRTHPHLGAGMLAEQVIYVPGNPKDPGSRARLPGGLDRLWYPGCPAYVSSRLGPLWSLYVFTDSATVIIQGGNTGRRVTTWAFHSCCAPQPRLGDRVVTFEGRDGRLHFLHGKPTPGGTEDVRTLDFEYDGGVSAFAFSDASFRFDKYRPEGVLRFRDSSGEYEVHVENVMYPPGHKYGGTLVWDEWDGFPRVEVVGRS